MGQLSPVAWKKKHRQLVWKKNQCHPAHSCAGAVVAAVAVVSGGVVCGGAWKLLKTVVLRQEKKSAVKMGPTHGVYIYIYIYLLYI